MNFRKFQFFLLYMHKTILQKKKIKFHSLIIGLKKIFINQRIHLKKDNHSYGFCSSDKMKCLWSWDKNQHFWEWFYVFIMTLGLWNFFSSEKNLTNEQYQVYFCLTYLIVFAMHSFCLLHVDAEMCTINSKKNSYCIIFMSPKIIKLSAHIIHQL